MVNCNRPKTGDIYRNMTETKKDFKYSLRQCRKNAEMHKANGQQLHYRLIKPRSHFGKSSIAKTDPHHYQHWWKGRGGARGVPGGATAPQNFAWPSQWPPQNFPRDVMALHWSPTQTIDSSPCCKTGPSSGPPKWKCLAPPLWEGQMVVQRLLKCGKTILKEY